MINVWTTGPDTRQLATDLAAAGYYTFGDALRTVDYWIRQGKTIAQIRESYHLGGEEDFSIGQEGQGSNRGERRTGNYGRHGGQKGAVRPWDKRKPY